MAEVSVIIVNYNTPSLTDKAVKSVIDNTVGVTYEIIVVDNGSETAYESREENVRVIRSDKNLGFAGGNNLGINETSSPFILLLNSDAELENNSLNLCKKYLDEKTNVGVVAARLTYPDGSIQHNCQRFPSWKYKGIELFRLQKLMGSKKRGRVLLGSFFDHNDTIHPDWVWGTFFFFRREILKSLPGKKLNDDYFMYGEDVQWCWDIRNQGWEISFLPTARVIHLMEGSKANKHKLIDESYNRFLNRNYSRTNRILTKMTDRLLQ